MNPTGLCAAGIRPAHSALLVIAGRANSAQLSQSLFGFFGVWLAIFGDGVIPATIALPLILNLLAGLIVSVRKVSRTHYGA